MGGFGRWAWSGFHVIELPLVTCKFHKEAQCGCDSLALATPEYLVWGRRQLTCQITQWSFGWWVKILWCCQCPTAYNKSPKA